MPDVSILIPAYNAENLIGKAIESALEQRDAAIEVIVIDDGSSDGTLTEIQRYADRIISETGPNRGATVARNRALELATSPWVSFLDADDYYLPNKVSAQLAALDDMDDVDVLYGPSTFEMQHADGVEFHQEQIPEPHDPWALLALWRLPQTGAPLWRREALLEVGGFTEDQPCCQEHELYLRLLMAGKTFAYANAGGAVYRRFANGTLSTRDPALVRTERRKIETRLERHLEARGKLTPYRQWAVNQARFDMARIAWGSDQDEAMSIHSEIRAKPFSPKGASAPFLYRIAYRLGGFRFAEKIAAMKRGTQA